MPSGSDTASGRGAPATLTGAKRPFKPLTIAHKAAAREGPKRDALEEYTRASAPPQTEDASKDRIYAPAFITETRPNPFDASNGRPSADAPSSVAAPRNASLSSIVSSSTSTALSDTYYARNTPSATRFSIVTSADSAAAVEALRKSLEGEKRRHEEMRRGLEEEKQRRMTAEAQRAHATRECADALADVEGLRGELKRAEAGTGAARAKEQLESARQELARAKKDLEQARKERDSKGADKKLKKALEELKVARKDRDVAVTDRDCALNDLQSARSDLKATHRDLQNTSRVLDSTRKDLQTAQGEAEGAQMLASQAVGDAHNEVAKMQEEVWGLQEELAALRMEHATVKGEYTRVKGEHATLKGEYAELQETACAAGVRAEQADAAQAQARQEADKLRRANERGRKGVETLTMEKFALAKERDTMAKEKDALTKERDALAKERDILVNETAELTADKDMLAARLVATQANVTKLGGTKRAWDGETERLQRDVVALKQQLRQAEILVSEVTGTVDVAEERSREAREYAGKARAQVEEARKALMLIKSKFAAIDASREVDALWDFVAPLEAVNNAPDDDMGHVTDPDPDTTLVDAGARSSSLVPLAATKDQAERGRTQTRGKARKRTRSPSDSGSDSSPLAKRLRRPISSRPDPAAVLRQDRLDCSRKSPPAPTFSRERSPTAPRTRALRSSRAVSEQERSAVGHQGRMVPLQSDDEDMPRQLRSARARRIIVPSPSPSPVHSNFSPDRFVSSPPSDQDLPPVEVEDDKAGEYEEDSSPARPLARRSRPQLVSPARRTTSPVSSLSSASSSHAASPAPSSHPPTPPPRRERISKQKEAGVKNDEPAQTMAVPAKQPGKKKSKKHESCANLPEDIPNIYPNYTDKKGRRICGQCKSRGRTRDGKCVERWGPSTLGRGTVCGACRKKNVKMLRQLQ